MNNVAIATTSGGYKSAFVQGVLSFFEEMEFLASAYASCSSSAMVVALAAVKKIKDFPLSVWYEGYKLSQQENKSQSDAAFYAIDLIYSKIEKEIFEIKKRFLVATSFVKTEEAELMTQSEKAKRLGQKLLIDASRKNMDWRDENLELHLYDTYKCEQTHIINDKNIKEVMYATTRMLHAWHIPANIDGKPYIDGSYTSLCPAVQMAELGYKEIICITTEHNYTQKDLFTKDVIPKIVNNSEIIFIKPDYDLSVIGVDYFKTTEQGLKKAYLHGIEKAHEFLKSYKSGD